MNNYQLNPAKISDFCGLQNLDFETSQSPIVKCHKNWKFLLAFRKSPRIFHVRGSQNSKNFGAEKQSFSCTENPRDFRVVDQKIIKNSMLRE
jgi:hypothetical protein